MKRYCRIDLLKKPLLIFCAVILAACKITVFPEPTSTVEPTVTVEPTAIPSPPTPAHPAAYVMEQIIAAITSKNTQALEGYMADTVQVRLEATECCGPLTKQEAMMQLSYIDPATGWNFDPTNPVIMDLAAAIPDHYGGDWIVGVASNEFVAAFKLNNQNKIEAYNLAVTYKILIY